MNKLIHATTWQDKTAQKQASTIQQVHEYLLSFAFILLFLGNNLFDKKVLALFLLLQLGLAIAYRAVDFVKNGWRFSGLLALLAWCSYSATWSQFPSATWSGVVLLATVMLAAVLGGYLAENINWQRALRNAIIIVLSINLLYVFAFHSAAISPDGLRSLYGTKNGLGLMTALSLCILFSVQQKRLIDYFFIVIASVLLVLSQSKTSLSLVLIIVAIGFIKKCFFGRYRIHYIDDAYQILTGVLWCVFLLSILAFFIYQKEVFNYIFQNLTDEMFTGRGKLWLEMLRQTEYKLLQGLGFNAVWGLDGLNQINFTPLAANEPFWVEKLVASDGGYVDIVVSIGTIGLAIFSFLLLQLLCDIFHANGIDMLLAIFLFVLFHNITETTFLMGLNINWFMLLFCAGVAAAEKAKFAKLKHE